jgi:hypothetical protein
MVFVKNTEKKHCNLWTGETGRSHYKIDVNIKIKVFWEVRCSRNLEEGNNRFSYMFVPIYEFRGHHNPEDHNVNKLILKGSDDDDEYSKH